MDMIKVKQSEEPIAAEVMAQAIVDIGEGMKRISRSPLRRDALVTLLNHTTKVGRKEIEYVLNSLEDLEGLYLKPKSAVK